MTVYFARPDALSGSLIETMKEVRPTVFMGVPRIYEKMEEKMKALGASVGTIAKKLSTWAKGVGYEHSMSIQNKQSAPFGYSLANFLILKRIKDALGLDQAKIIAFGAAPMKRSTLDYFLSLDMQILNFYGMSETAACETVCWKGRVKFGIAGQACPGTHIKIFNPNEKGEGEICFKGRNMFVGYIKNEKATRETIDSEGYVHSGDLGFLDEDGFVNITGRIKELIITAGGENVAPIPMEHKFTELCPIASQIMVIGDDRKFLSCLITFKTVMSGPSAQPTTELTPEAKEFIKTNIGSTVKDSEEACKDSAVMTYIQKIIDETNTFSISKAAYIRKFKLLPLEFTISGGEMTPTMKLKRKFVEKKYSVQIEDMYENAKI